MISGYDDEYQEAVPVSAVTGLVHRKRTLQQKDRKLVFAAHILANGALIIDTFLLPVLGSCLVVFFFTLWGSPRDNNNSIDAKYVCQCDYQVEGHPAEKSCYCEDYAKGHSDHYPLIQTMFAWAIVFLPDIGMALYLGVLICIVSLYVVLYLLAFVLYSLYVAARNCCCDARRTRDRSHSISTFDRKFQLMLCCGGYAVASAHKSFMKTSKDGCGMQCCEDFWSCSFLDALLICCDGSTLKYTLWLVSRVLGQIACVAWLILFPILDCSCPVITDSETGDTYHGRKDYDNTWDNLLPVARSYAIAYIILVCVLIAFRWGAIFILRRIPLIPQMNAWAFTYLAIPVHSARFTLQ